VTQGPRTSRLVNIIEEAEHLLRKHGEPHRADWLNAASSEIRAGDFRGVEHVLAGFGGMGSLTIFVFAPLTIAELKTKTSDR